MADQYSTVRRPHREQAMTDPIEQPASPADYPGGAPGEVTGPGPDAGGTNHGNEPWRHTPEKSGTELCAAAGVTAGAACCATAGLATAMIASASRFPGAFIKTSPMRSSFWRRSSSRRERGCELSRKSGGAHAGQIFHRPHPEEARSAVSKDGPTRRGLRPSFETRPSDAPQDEVRKRVARDQKSGLSAWGTGDSARSNSRGFSAQINSVHSPTLRR